jgi:uncharacterized protein (TIGR02996 family)
MGDFDALLAAVRGRPEDDGARLALADWLQEHGNEPWAELIRVQVELARPGPERPGTMAVDLLSSEEHVRRVESWRAYAERREQLDRRERELLAAPVVPAPRGWRVGVGLGFGRREGRLLLLRRGFAERALCTAEEWLADGDAILATHPLRRATLATLPEFKLAEGAVRLTGRHRTWPLPHDAGRGDARAWAAYLLKLEWPGVEFDLPGG